MSPRRYLYVGSRSILERLSGEPPGTKIRSADDLRAWVRAQGGRTCTATYTVGEDGVLTLADRHSEHVACAGGGPVLAAGELTTDGESVEQVTNQSTGYCPEPSCWPAVGEALARLGVDHPAGFAPAYEFRRCEGCGQIHLLKDDGGDCAVCGRALPEVWNLA